MALFNCPNCGNQISSRAKICPSCGLDFDKIKKCPECGEYNPLEAETCRKCGNPFKVKGVENPAKKKMITTIIIIILGLAVAALIALLIFKGGSSKYEGKGYASPEKAIEAYAEGMKKGDLKAMKKVFAIESYVDNADIEKNIERLGAYMSYGGMLLPGKGDFTKQINYERRNTQVSNQIVNQYIAWAAKEGYDPSLVAPLEDQTPKELLEQCFDMDGLDRFPSIKVKGIIDIDDIPELDAEPVMEAIEKQADRINDMYGSSDYEPVCIELEIDGKTYAMPADAIEYDGKWYLYSIGGFISSFLGLDTISGGLFEY